MADKIADLFIALGVDTTGLRESERALKRLSDATAKAARRTSKDGIAAAAILNRQERAAHRALKQAANLTRKLKEVGAPEQDVQDLAAAYKHLAERLSRVGIKQQTVNHHTEIWSATVDKTRAKLREYQKTQREVAHEGETRLSRAFRNMESASVLAIGPLSALGARIRSIGAIASRSSLGITVLIGSIVGAGVAAVALSRKVVDATRELERTKAALFAAFGNEQLVDDAFEKVAQISSELGTNLSASAREFAKLQAAAQSSGISFAVTEKLFKGIALATASLKLDAGETAGVFRAFQQMISKGTVQAEELRNQLGDRLPGAFGLVAKALGVTTAELGKMLKAGQVLSSEAIPKIADAFINKYAEPGAKAAQELTAREQALGTAFFRLATATDEVLKISIKYKDVVTGLEERLDNMRANLPSIVSSVSAFGAGLAALLTVPILRWTWKLLKNLKNIYTAAKKFTQLAASAGTLAAAVKAFPVTRIVSIVATLAAVLTASIVTYNRVKDALKETAQGYEDLSASVYKFLKVAREDPLGSTSRAGLLLEKRLEHRKELLQDIARIEGLIAEERLRLRRQGHTEGTIPGQGSSLVSAHTFTPLERLEQRLEGLRAKMQFIIGPEVQQLGSVLTDAASKRLSPAYNKLSGRISDIIGKNQVLTASIRAVTREGADFEFTKSLNEADKYLKSILPGDLSTLMKDLEKYPGDTVRERLAALIEEGKRLDKVFGNLGNIKTADRAIAELELRSADLREETVLLTSDLGPFGKELAAAAKTLDVAGTSSLRAGESMETFREALHSNALAKDVESMRDRVKKLQTQLGLLREQRELLEADPSLEKVPTIPGAKELAGFEANLLRYGEANDKVKQQATGLISVLANLYGLIFAENEKLKRIVQGRKTGDEPPAVDPLATSEHIQNAQKLREKLQQQLAVLQKQRELLETDESLTKLPKVTGEVAIEGLDKILELPDLAPEVRTALTGLRDDVTALQNSILGEKGVVAAILDPRKVADQFISRVRGAVNTLRASATELQRQFIAMQQDETLLTPPDLSAFNLLDEIDRQLASTLLSPDRRRELTNLRAAYTVLNAAVERLGGSMRDLTAARRDEQQAQADEKRTTQAAKDQVQGILREIALLEEALARAGEEGAGELIGPLKEVDGILRNLSTAGAGELTQLFAGTKFAGEDLKAAAEAMIAYRDALEAAIRTANKPDAIEDAVKGVVGKVEDLTFSTFQARQQITALLAGAVTSGSQSKLADALEVDAELRSLRQGLIEAGVPAERIASSMRRWKQGAIALRESQRELAELQRQGAAIEEAFRQPFQNVADQLATAFATGEQAALSFRDVAVSVVRDVISEILRQVAVNPLVQLFAGLAQRGATAFANYLNFGGQPAAGTPYGPPTGYGRPTAAKGTVLKYARGGVLPGPTMFRALERPVLGGEAGPEALVPLKRLAGGRLGVSAEGLQNQVNVIINNNDSGNNEVSLRRQQGPQGEDIFVTIERRLAASVARGGPLASAIGSVGSTGGVR